MKIIYSLISIFIISITSSFTQVLPNAGFENWTHNAFPSYDAPDGWNNLNPSTTIIGTTTCYKATSLGDYHSGSSAIKLITKTAAGQTANGIATTGTINTSAQTIVGGVAFTGSRPDSIAGWYKYTSVTGDNGFVELQLLGTGGDADTVGYVRFKTPSTTIGSYTYFKKAITYRNANPIAKTIWILSASADAITHFVGSTLFIDDLQLIVNPATTVLESVKPELTLGPNPATDHLIIKNNVSQKTIFTLYDITGRKMIEQKLDNVTSVIDLISLPLGLYIYSIVDETKKVIKTGKIVLQK